MTPTDLDARRTCECSCGCDEKSTGTDEGGNHVCDECSEYLVTDEGDVVCSRQTDSMTVCHVCGDPIEWGNIVTGGSGSGAPNYRPGSCSCGEDAWCDEDRGGWGHFSYSPVAAAEEAEEV